jgi:hypothetical protein
VKTTETENMALKEELPWRKSYNVARVVKSQYLGLGTAVAELGNTKNDSAVQSFVCHNGYFNK